MTADSKATERPWKVFTTPVAPEGWTDQQIEMVARRLAYDVWPLATEDERNKWAHWHWKEWLSRAKNALEAARAAPTPPERKDAPDPDAIRNAALEEAALHLIVSAAKLREEIDDTFSEFGMDEPAKLASERAKAYEFAANRIRSLQSPPKDGRDIAALSSQTTQGEGNGR